MFRFAAPYLLFSVPACIAQAATHSTVSCSAPKPDSRCEVVYKDGNRVTTLKTEQADITVSPVESIGKTAYGLYVTVKSHVHALDVDPENFYLGQNDKTVLRVTPAAIALKDVEKSELRHMIVPNMLGGAFDNRPAFVTHVDASGDSTTVVDTAGNAHGTNRARAVIEQYKNAEKNSLKHNTLNENEAVGGYVYFVHAKDKHGELEAVSTRLDIGDTTYLF